MLTTTKGAEAKLVEMLGEISDAPVGWKALYFHFAELMSEYKSDYQLKIAINLINDLLRDHDAGLFVCADGSLILLCRELTKQLESKVIFQLRYLFMDDPLAYGADGQENDAFCTACDLGRQFTEFREMATRSMAATARRGGGPVAAPAAPRRAAPMPKLPAAEPVLSSGGRTARTVALSALHLAGIERDLANADLSKVLRRQPVCAAVPSMMIRKVFDELYIHITHLRQMLKADVDFLSNKWLFKYLTQILDERVINLLRHNPGRYLDSPVSLNLNVETLLSDWFAEFDATVKPAVKVSIVIEIQVADVFADMSAFLYAKNTVQKLGYRVCLDGLNSLSFTQVDREKLGFDLAKLQWNADLETDLKSKENRQLAEAIKVCGPNRVILCRCDTKHAIDYGQALGVSLFQGRFLDMILNPTAKVEN